MSATTIIETKVSIKHVVRGIKAIRTDIEGLMWIFMPSKGFGNNHALEPAALGHDCFQTLFRA